MTALFLALLLPGVSAFVPGQTVQNPGATPSSRFRLPDTQVEAGPYEGLNLLADEHGDPPRFSADATLPVPGSFDTDAAPLRMPGQPQNLNGPEIAKAQENERLFRERNSQYLGQPMPAHAQVPRQPYAQATVATAAKPEGNGSFFGPGMVYGGAAIACLLIVSGGVVVARKKAHARTVTSAQEGEVDSRRDFMTKAATGLAAAAAIPGENLAARRDVVSAAAGVMATGVAVQPAVADVDYDGIKYLGGGDKIDLNNANVRAYLRLPGMYPNAAGKIAGWKGEPFKQVSDVYKIAGLTEGEKKVIKQNEARFVVLAPKPEYVIDRLNNGLYR